MFGGAIVLRYATALNARSFHRTGRTYVRTSEHRRFPNPWLATLVLLLLSAAMPCKAQDYPSRPVRIVVPAAPGGSFDALARILAQGLSERWPQRMIVDNRPGGGGNIGAGAVAKADPDGYTLLTWNDLLLINPWLFKELPFDPKKDFTPISLSMYSPNVLAAHPSSGIKTFEEFLKGARATPGKLNYGSPGNGSPGHLSAEILKQLAQIDVVHVPYRGAGPQSSIWWPGKFRWAWSRSPALSVTSGPDIGRVGCHFERARQGDAYGSDHRGGGRAGLSDQCVSRHSRARRHAAGNRRETRGDITEVLKSPAVSQKLIDLGFDPVAGRAQISPPL